MSLYGRFARPLLFALEPEKAHRAAIAALRAGITPRAPAPDPRLERSILGLTFPSPIGMAAGFDKDAEVPDATLALGFGFVEVGTVTPRPQAGNPRPRQFRLRDDRAIINRMGFNNAGFDAVLQRLEARRQAGIVGVNIGANKDSADRIADYAAGVARFAPVADYLTVNISSPNTPGLRDLQAGDRLDALLSAVTEARAAADRRVPLLVKVAPDLEAGEVLNLVATVVRHGIDGMIVANTTLDRTGLSDRRAREDGGLSGQPLFVRSTRLLARVRRLAGDRLVLIGAGGVDSADTSWDKLAAGADLVQLYTGLVYEGPTLPARINAGLAARLDEEGYDSIADVVGTRTDAWQTDN